VFVGALIFETGAGGTLPFFALVALPLLLFGPSEMVMMGLGVALPLLLFTACETGFAARLFAVTPKPTPVWYFAANAASAFAVAFVIPYFFYRTNLRAEAAIERMGREKLTRVIDSNLIGVVRGRLSGRLEEANDTFLTLLGHTRLDLVTGALDLQAIAPLDGAHGGPRAWAELARRGASFVYERTCMRKDGTCVPVLVGVAVLDESLDEVVGFVLDLSAQKQIEAQNTLLRESREALRLRDLFSSIASHELKTPLTALLLNLKILRRRTEKDAPENDALRLQLERCEASAARMGELIHTLLDVAQIHDGKLKLTRDEMDVVEAARRVASGFEGGRTVSGAIREIQIEADGPVTARLDPVRFDQMLSNLLSNAVKYGAGKPIEVRIRHDGAADTAHLEVIDHGPGIEPTMTQRIFEPFQRGVAAGEPIPGLGLGLYVVKMIVEGHGGRIGVDSRLGQGSRFIVDLPCAHAATSSAVQP
jgi:PAS domain S-box-containing protein